VLGFVHSYLFAIVVIDFLGLNSLSSYLPLLISWTCLQLFAIDLNNPPIMTLNHFLKPQSQNHNHSSHNPKASFWPFIIKPTKFAKLFIISRELELQWFWELGLQHKC